VVFGSKIDESPALPLDHAQPRFNVVHPCTMHRRKVHDNARVIGSPRPDFFPLMRTDRVTHEMHEAEARVNLGLPDFQKGHAFPLTLPFVTWPINRAGTGGKGRQEVAGPRPLRRMCGPVGHRLRLGWQGRGPTGSRWQGRLFVPGPHQFIPTP
jgi:hypothetical protein